MNQLLPVEVPEIECARCGVPDLVVVMAVERKEHGVLCREGVLEAVGYTNPPGWTTFEQNKLCPACGPVVERILEIALLSGKAKVASGN